MMIALKMTAARIADCGLCSRMMFSRSRPGNIATNIAGMIAKYFAMSLAIENVVSAPRVISSCFRRADLSAHGRGAAGGGAAGADPAEFDGDLAALGPDPLRDRVGCPLAEHMPVEVDTRHPCRGGEFDPVRMGELTRRAGSQAVLLLGEYDDRAPLGRLVGEAGQLRGLGQRLGGCPPERGGEGGP